jgi:hypothetical protein
MDKTLVAQGVANKLFATEKAVDTAIAEAATLLMGMMQAREELRLSATVGATTSAKVAEAISLLSQARSTMVEAHLELDQLKLRQGIRTKMIGSFSKDLAQDDDQRSVAKVDFIRAA